MTNEPTDQAVSPAQALDLELEHMLRELRTLGAKRDAPCGVHTEPQWTCAFCLHNVLERVEAEHIRAILHFTVKGYTAGENTDAKHWRKRAEEAEAELGRLRAPSRATPGWDAKAAYREGFMEREQEFDCAWNNSLTKHRTEAPSRATPEEACPENIGGGPHSCVYCGDFLPCAKPELAGQHKALAGACICDPLNNVYCAMHYPSASRAMPAPQERIS